MMETSKVEQSSCDKSSVVEKSNPQAPSKYWIAALVKMNTERKVSAKLTQLGYHNYVPTQTEIRQWSDRKKKIERVIIPMIIFIQLDKEEEVNLRRSSIVYKFISYPGKKEAAVIPNEQIEKLKFMLHNADSAVEFSDTAYEIGEEVEIVRGPLKGLYGELCYTEKGNPMLGIYIKLLGYSYVSVDIKDVMRRG
ncbi:MAG: UpxY family transcription antiterminator [Bacteroidaceae bacterium]|nr:UpxY family transcription antiterminator [Bacteroidaceae bacterium]